MSNTKLYIPKTLNVGYQDRNNTYTGKLAYVIYYDDKGVLRKEKSWRSWCKEFIGDVENTPTEGFVLNKGVGGQRESWGWNARNEYIRVYDPRGWEFEISVANLLFILQECTSTKGKGLEGEFVYSWDGTELVLLPTCCKEYKASKEFTSDQEKKVTKKGMVEGKYYKFKTGVTAVYLGRHECTENFFTTSGYYDTSFKKCHVFYDDVNDKYIYQKGFTKLASVGEVCDNYAEYLEGFLKGWRCNKVVDYYWEILDKNEDLNKRIVFVNIGNEHFKVSVDDNYYYNRNVLLSRGYDTLESFIGSNYRRDHVTTVFLKDKTVVKPIFILENNEEIGYE